MKNSKNEKEIQKLPDNFFEKDYFFNKKHSNYLNYNYWDNDLYWNSIIKYIKKRNIGGRVLDVGCAFGFLLKRMFPYFGELYGLDISGFAIDKAKQNVPQAIYKKIDLNKTNIPFPDNYFDLITALDVLEHTVSIDRTLKKIVPKLKKNGYLIISLPIKNSVAGKIFHFFDKDRSHISIPTIEELEKVIVDNNLKIIKRSYFFNAAFFKIKGVPVDVEFILQRKS